MKIAFNVLVVAGLFAATAQTAFSQGTIYTSRSAFQAALSSSTTITFEDLPTPNPNPIGEYSITTSGVTFTNPGALLFVTYPGGLYPIPGDGKYLWHFDGGFPVTVLLPSGVTAFGSDFSGGVEPNPSFNGTLTVNLLGGGSHAYNFTGSRGSWIFFGATFSQPISSVIYDDGGSFLHEEMFDNFTFGNAIPEPGTLGLFALGALLLGWRCLRGAR